MIALPEPRSDGTLSVEQALGKRRSVREYAEGPLTLVELGQVLWAAQGVTEPQEDWPSGLRTAPSAGALYPLELYVLAAQVDGLDVGLYRYVPREHALQPVAGGDVRKALGRAALRDRSITGAPAVLVVAAEYRRTAVKYGDRAERYVHIEVGAVAQNVHLQSESLGLGTVIVGAFHDEAVKSALDLPPGHEPLAVMPLGRQGAD